MYADARHDSPISISPCTPTTKFQFSTYPSPHSQPPQQQVYPVDAHSPTPIPKTYAYASLNNDASKAWPLRSEDAKTAPLSPDPALSHSPNFFSSACTAASPNSAPFTY